MLFYDTAMVLVVSCMVIVEHCKVGGKLLPRMGSRENAKELCAAIFMRGLFTKRVGAFSKLA